MTAVSALGAAATLISSAFALCTLDRWTTRRRPHEAAWTQSLAMFALGSFAYWSAGATGWSTANFRAFYLFGAIVNVPYLAVGTVYLLAGPTIGRRVHLAVHVLSAFCAGVVMTSATVAPIEADRMPQGRDVFGIVPRVMAAVGSGLAATVLIVGAVWSAVRLLRSRHVAGPIGLDRAGPTSAARLVATNVAIAIGSLVLGAGGAFFTDGQQEVGFGILLVIGVGILFGGFLLSPAGPHATTGPPASERRPGSGPGVDGGFVAELRRLIDAA